MNVELRNAGVREETEVAYFKTLFRCLIRELTKSIKILGQGSRSSDLRIESGISRK